MDSYLSILDEVLARGEVKDTRTGIRTLSIEGAMFVHDMQKGFPLLTTKFVAQKSVRIELDGFIHGVTDKRWLQERGCHIWDEWCSRKIIPYSDKPEIQSKMLEERDLGPIYGFQWRHFDAEYNGYAKDYTGKGVDQLANVLKTLKTNPTDRRMLVNAWNPKQIDEMALPPCHDSWQLLCSNGKLNLIWRQRSVDVALGLPFNISSYATLLHLVAKEAGMQEGKLIGQLGDLHIYENHTFGVLEQLKRKPFDLPQIETKDFISVEGWTYDKTSVVNYKSHPKINFPIAV
ncbi:MAG: thymidylate synthase [Nanoarchaeota archaeon]